MSNHCEHRLSHLLNAGQSYLLRLSRIGLEREGLRVSPGGCIAQTPHPPALGAALTHPYITTDYSEALLEFITPPYPRLPQALDFLRDLQQFVYPQLGEELLWAGSMPCVATGENSIPIAWYGRSHLGMMKHIYRRGLGYRYGRMMQVIAGVHFNYSLDDAFWRVFQELEQNRRPLPEFRSDGYFRMIRNLQRFGWLIPYLFGASPALCKSFLAGRPTALADFDADTCFQPYGTSLRMSDIGYTNRREKTCGSDIHYDNLETYVDTLSWATETLCPEYEKLGVMVDGEYRQLNANILQIEAEYYSTVRPKQIPQGNEKPSLALQRRGVQYVELRSLDVNPFEPLGVNADALRFVETFMIFCLLRDSPVIDMAERREIDDNQLAVAGEGRNPALQLQQHERQRPLKEWAMEIVAEMEGIGEVLDGDDPQRPYSRSLALQREVIDDPEQTPSAKVLAQMRANKESFFAFAKRLSQSHRDFFMGLPPNAEHNRFFEEEARKSWERQQELERDDKLSFDEFLRQYFA